MQRKALPIFALAGIIVLSVSVISIKTLAQSGPAKTQAAKADPQAARPNPERQAALADIQNTFGFTPRFFTELPAGVLAGTWQEMKSLQMGKNTALPPKVKELIGLGVSAQIPCTYCVEAHREFARANGATDAELGEAVAMAALTRQWSTVMNGMQLDEKRFRADIDKMLSASKQTKQGKAAGAQASQPVKVTDGRTALQDINRVFGFTPEFLAKMPDAARAGAWQAWRDVELNPNTALPAKQKSLISLAVASQVPCGYCIVADKEFARADGATEAEIAEAVAMGAFTRHMSTLLNGMDVDRQQFASDVARITRGAQAATAPPKPSTKAQ
jgi:AhpD family alkylhydroperoxidase